MPTDDNVLSAIDSWPVPTAAAAVIGRTEVIAAHGPTDHVFALASISKMLTAWAVLVAVEEGTIDLTTMIGQPGCTLRHLLAHAGGYPFDGDQPIAEPGRRRVYSNTGIELAATAVATHTGIDFATYLGEAVFAPLGMTASILRGSPAAGVHSTVDDLARFAAEVLEPSLLSTATVDDALTPQWPDLAGVVPGFGAFRPCPWGLGFEIHGDKHPHWMAVENAAGTVGHFGGSGTMMWIDRQHDLALIALTDRPFDQWSIVAAKQWPLLGRAVLARHAAGMI